MSSTWTSFFYGESPVQFAPLASSNWTQWNDDVLRLLQPYDGVVDILHGKVESSSPFYNTTVDNELFFFLVRSIDREYMAQILDARARYGLMGSKLYQKMKAHLQVKQEESTADFELTGIKLAPSPSTSTEPRREPQETHRPIPEPQSTRSGRRRGMTPLCFKAKTYPVLSTAAWPEWDSRLRKEASAYKSALQKLTGIFPEGHIRYNRHIDADLFYIIRLTAIKNYTPIVEQVLAEHGRKGSELYFALKKCIQSQATAMFATSVKRMPEVTKTADECYRSLEQNLQIVRRYDVNFSREHIGHFVEMIGKKFSSPMQ